MLKIVYSYLDRQYILSKDADGYYAIYISAGDELDYVYASDLIESLTTIFLLTEREVKRYVRTWVRSKDKTIKLNRYWKKMKIIFPGVRRVMASLLGQELIAVQPMAAPTANLLYFDCVYSGVTYSGEAGLIILRGIN